MYTNNDRQVVTPQLRRLAGRHARYFDYSLEGPWGPCREMRRSARVKTPRCGATSSRVRRQTSNVAHRSDSLSLPGDASGGATMRAMLNCPSMGPSFFYFWSARQIHRDRKQGEPALSKT